MTTMELIKALRDRTGAGLTDCKKALTENGDDLEKATDWLREKGIAKAAKKADRIAAEGLTTIVSEGNYALICEVNSETDFVAKNEKFINFVNTIAKAMLDAKSTSVEEGLTAACEGATVNDCITNNIATIGEKLSLRRITLVTKNDTDTFGTYLHMGGKIGTVCVLTNTDNAVVAKDVAMHIAAMSPSYVKREDIPADEIERERHIQKEAAKNDEKLMNKPEAALEKILDGKISKWMSEISLVDQPFFKDEGTSVGNYASQFGSSIATFVRYAVGEGLQKREENFAEEVAKQTK